MCYKRFIVVVTFLVLAIVAHAQVPQSITSQAVLRNSNGALVANRQVSVRVSILQGSPQGLAVYVETHTPTTNINGLYTISVGNGTPVTGSFALSTGATVPTTSVRRPTRRVVSSTAS